MKKILILTAGFGDGHNAAARNLRDALERVSDEAQVEILDLFDAGYGTFNHLLKKTYLGLVQHVPGVWGSLYALLDNAAFIESQFGPRSRLCTALESIFEATEPDCVVSTYPIYAHAIRQIYKDHAERPFRLITVVTDSITIHSCWYRAPSDLFIVPNDRTARILTGKGVAPATIHASGFPVSPDLGELPPVALAPPHGDAIRRVLYLINTGRKKAGRVIDELLDLPNVHLTVSVGRDAELKTRLLEQTRDRSHRVRLLGWTNQMPQLMLSHHLVVTKAGGATVQEAIAARCPIIVNQVIPGQEEGNARLVEEFGIGAVADGRKEVIRSVEQAFAHKARVWLDWRARMTEISRPDASLRAAALILEGCEHGAIEGRRCRLFPSAPPVNGRPAAVPVPRHATQSLLCDFHIHTNYSDGSLTLPEVVDFYGRLGFDCICITDHLADPRRLIGKLVRLSRLALGAAQLEEYFEVCDKERRRAWRKYGMLVMTGVEFNKDGYTPKTSAHLLGIDLKGPMPADWDLPVTIDTIHAQGGLAIASHPHVMKSEWGKNTLYLWNHQDRFAPLLDAWEIANRNNIFTPVGLKRLSFGANSDFHKPRHIFSWKALLHCEKDPEAIKDCIRRNERVAITLYRQGMTRDTWADPTRIVQIPGPSTNVPTAGTGASEESRAVLQNTT